MFKAIALAVAIAATAGVAGAQATGTKTTTAKGCHSVEKGESQAALQQEAKISEATARATALREVPNGTIKSSELEREHGTLIYSFDIVVPSKTGIEEVAVSALNGSIVAHEHETPKMEKSEAAQEAKERKAKK